MSEVPLSDNDVYCWLRQKLEPRFHVLSEPAAEYHCQQQFRYVVLNDGRQVADLSGDFRLLTPGQLTAEACRLVERLSGAEMATNRSSAEDHRPASEHEGSAGLPIIAGRLPPLSHNRTWFSSGRAAFLYLISRQIRPRRVWLPAYCCWSLISTVLERLPELPLRFYAVDCSLNCSYPDDLDSGDAVVFIHYFGHYNTPPDVPPGCFVLEDFSHVLNPAQGTKAANWLSFGSLRKTFRVADGGFAEGFYPVAYEADLHQAAWLRRSARDWRDLREAENMLDRSFAISDMSSQSLATVLSCDRESIALQRQQNEACLRRHFPVGAAVVDFSAGEVPLLHNRLMSTTEDRDSLRSFLAGRGIFCSIHWPVHPLLEQFCDAETMSGANSLAQRVLSIPISEDFGIDQMQRICETAREWLEGQ